MCRAKCQSVPQTRYKFRPQPIRYKYENKSEESRKTETAEQTLPGKPGRRNKGTI